MEKLIITGDEAKTKLLAGIQKLSSTVKITLGPKGRNVILGRGYASPLITNDGVTIAKEIELNDRIENLGAQIIKEVCIKTNDIAGDGTTTATVLAEKMFSEGLKSFVAGANPIKLKNGINNAIDLVVDTIKSNAKKVNDRKDIIQVAAVSAGNSEVGELIASAFDKVGKGGIITIEEGNGMQTSLGLVDGLKFDKGYISPYMCTDNNKMQAVLENPYILVTDKKISSINEILPILEKVAAENVSLLIIAEDIDGDALTTIIYNNIRKVFNCVGVKAAHFGDRRKNFLNDVALSTGATCISNELFSNFKDVNLSDLGRAKKVIVGKDNTTIIDALGDKNKVEERVENLREKLKNSDLEFDKDILNDRLAKLNGMVAVIKVGALTEIEMKEKKLRIEDALNATRSAIEEGVIAGGGVAILKTKNILNKCIDKLEEDEKMGAIIVSKIIEEPLRQICKNAGVDDGVVVNKILENEDVNFGYDALNDEYCNMFETGIIDPLKVTKSALLSAASVVSTLLTTECVVVDDKNKDEI